MILQGLRHPLFSSEGVGGGRAVEVSGHRDLRRGGPLGGKKREGQEGHCGRWNKEKMEAQERIGIRLRGTRNGEVGERKVLKSLVQGQTGIH